MKNIKRLVALVLAMVMAFGTLATVSAAGTQWYTEAVNYLENSGIATIGSKAGTKITRAEFALWIAKVEAGQKFVDDNLWKEDGLADVIIFSDVDESVDGVYRAAINYCYQRKFVRGNGDGTYSPNAEVTLAEASAVIVRLMGYEGKVPSKTRTDGDDWEYNYWNIANNYCNAFDKTFVEETGTVDPKYTLTYGEAAYLVATILNWGAKTNICLTAEGENLGEKFPAGTIGVSNQIAIVTGMKYVTRTWDYLAWTYSIKEWTYNGDNFTWPDGYQFTDFTTNVIDETSTATLVLIGEDGVSKGTVEIPVATLKGYVRVSLGLSSSVDKKSGEIFNLGDYISNGSVVGVEYDSNGNVSGLTVGDEKEGTRLISDTFLVATGTTSKMVYNYDGTIKSYGKYPYLSNSSSSTDYTPVLPTAYTADKVITISGSKLTLGETTYTVVNTRSVEADQLAIYSINDAGIIAGPLSAANAKKIIPNTAEGEHCVEFTDLDGDGKFDIAVVREYAFFQYRNWTNGDPANVAKDKCGPLGGVILDKTVKSVSGSDCTTDAWNIDDTPTGKIQLIVAASNKRNVYQERYYGSTSGGANEFHPGGIYVLPAYTVVDIATLTTGYIKNVEKEPVSINGKSYYKTTIVSVEDGTEKQVYVPVTSEDVTAGVSVSLTIADATTTVTLFSGDWMPFVTEYEAAKDIGIAGDASETGTDEESGAWMLDKVVKYTTIGELNGTSGQTADVVCAMVDTTTKDVTGFLVDVTSAGNDDNTYNVTVATTGQISDVEWCNVTDVYFTMARKPAWQPMTANGVYWASTAWVYGSGLTENGQPLNAFEKFGEILASLNSVDEIETTTLGDCGDNGAYVLKTVNAVRKDDGKTLFDETTTLKTVITEIYGANPELMYESAKADMFTPEVAGLIRGGTALTLFGVTNEDAWAKTVTLNKANGVAWNYTSVILTNIAKALATAYSQNCALGEALYTMPLADFDATFGTTLATTYAGVANLKGVAALVGGDVDLDQVAFFVEADYLGMGTVAGVTTVGNVLQFVESIVHSGFYTKSKFIWNKVPADKETAKKVGSPTAPDFGWFTALVTAQGATGVKTFTVRASASSIWDYDNYYVYNQIFKNNLVLEHEGGDDVEFSGYDLIYVQVMKDGSSYVIQYLGEDSAVYQNVHTFGWAAHRPDGAALYTSDNNATMGDAWDCKAEFAYQNTTDTAAILSWKKYSSEVILDGVDLSKFTEPGTYEATITVGINPYYAKIKNGSAITGYGRYYFEKIATYSKVFITVEYEEGETYTTYIPVIDEYGVQISVTNAAEKASWESLTVDTQGSPVAYKVINNKLFKVNTTKSDYKYDENGKPIIKKTVDYSQMVLESEVAYNAQVEKVSGMLSMRTMTKADTGYFPGAYLVELDGRSYIAAENVKIVIMTPDKKGVDVQGKVYTVKELAGLGHDLYVTDYQVAANGTSLNQLSVIGELLVEEIPTPVVDTSTLVYLGKDGVTIEAIETGDYFVVRSTYSASIIPSCETFGSIYNKYDTYAEAKYYQETVKLGITTGYYRVNDDGEIVSIASEAKKGTIKAADVTSSASFTIYLDGKSAKTGDYKWAFLYTDFDGNLYVASESINVEVKTTEEIAATLDSAEKAVATAETTYNDIVAAGLNAAIQAEYKAKWDAAIEALDAAKEKAIASYLNGTFWGVANSPVFKYAMNSQYTWQKQAKDITFDYIFVDGVYCVFVNSFAYAG